MPFLNFLFSPQHYKANSGYYINHDTLMAVSQQARRKLICYFIAEQTPQKIEPQDLKLYYFERNYSVKRVVATYTFMGGLFVPSLLGLARNSFYKYNTLNRSLILLGAIGFGLVLGNSIGWRVTESMSVQNGKVLSALANKYNFGIYDFSVAKKQSHLKKLLQVMDSHHETLHVKQHQAGH